jgi:hypothetical protein
LLLNFLDLALLRKLLSLELRLLARIHLLPSQPEVA